MRQVFAKYNSLLMSENYVTRRQSLKLLGEILLDRSNFEIMMKYIGYGDAVLLRPHCLALTPDIGMLITARKRT
jgi:calcium binding protein 39